MQLRQRIHSLIMTLVEAGPFYPVAYVRPVAGQKYPRMVVDESSTLLPDSCEANETQLRLDKPVDKMAGDGRREVREVMWEVHMAFPRAVDAKDFLDGFSGTFDPTPLGLPSLRLELQDAEAVHPPREGEQGSYLRLDVRVIINPT